MTGVYSCPSGYQQIKLHTGSTSSSRSEHVCHSYWIFWEKCHDNYYSSSATYDLYWCVDTGTVPPDSGYLFGGLFTSRVDNPVTRARSCPPTFFPLKVASGGELQVCISDDYELGGQYALPFAGFISCDAGNPLAAGGDASVKAAQGPGVKSRGNLRAMFQSEPNDWPKRCPDGFSSHLALVDQGCQINYCVQTGSMAGPVLPPIKRPPFVPAPPVSAPPSDNLVIFDPATNTWKRNADAIAMMQLTPAASKGSALDNTDTDYNGEPTSSASTVTPGAAAGIAIAATLACVVLATVAVIAVRRRRRRNTLGYRRLEPSSLPGNSYGSVEDSNVSSSTAVVRVDVD